MITKSIKNNISLVSLSFVAIITIIIIAIGYFTYETKKNTILAERFNELSAIRTLKVEQIIEWRKERLGDANVILHNPFVTEDIRSYVFSGNEQQKENIFQWFQLLKKYYKYEEVILLDSALTPLIISGSSYNFTKEHLENKMFINSVDSVSISPLHNIDGEKIHYSIGISFRDDDGSVYAHLLIVLDPKIFLYPLIQKWPIPSKSAETVLIRQEGDSLIFLNELTHRPNSALKFKMSAENSNLPAAQALKGRTGFFRGVDYRGVEVLSDIGPVPGTNWFVVAKIDEDEILGDLKTTLIYSIIIVILLLAVSYLVILMIQRRSKMKAMKTELELQKDKIRLTHLYATLSQINQAIVREQSKSELLLMITSLPVKFGNFKACAVYIRENEEEPLKVESFAGELDYFHNILDDNSEFIFEDPSVPSAKNSETVIKNQLNEKSEGWQSIAIKCGIKSCAAAPINPFGQTIGSLTLYSEEENFFQIKEIKLLEEITSDISFSLEMIEKIKRRRIIEKKIKENEKRLAILFSNLPGIAYRCKFDKDFTMEFMSEGTFNITGYTPEEIVNHKLVTFNNMILPEDREYVRDEIKKAIEMKSAFTIIYRITTRSNHVRWVWERGIALWDEDGKVEALEGFISDITEVKEAQDHVRKSEEKFRYLFHNNPLPMWIYDKSNYRFIEVNNSAVEVYGYSKEEFLEMSILDIRTEEDRQKLIEYLKIPRPEGSISREWVHRYKNGEIKDVLTTSHQIEYNNKSAVLVVSIDITERKIAEQATLNAKEKAEASEKLKSDFLAQMSHEIRTPVNVILSFSSLIKDEFIFNITPDLKIGFEAINHASKRLIRTIDSILNMAQITSGSFNIRPVVVDLFTDILTPLKDEFENIAKSKDLEFRLENRCKYNKVLGDRYSLSQIFANLIDNAIKYTNEGFVIIYFECDHDKISVNIEDSGIGISEEFLPNIFSAFSQEQTGYCRSYEGTGLGLTLVQNYCTINKAEISVKSKKSEGTTFTVIMNKYIG